MLRLAAPRRKLQHTQHLRIALQRPVEQRCDLLLGLGVEMTRRYTYQLSRWRIRASISAPETLPSGVLPVANVRAAVASIRK